MVGHIKTSAVQLWSQSLAGLKAQNGKNLPREEVRQAFQKEPDSDWEEECRCSDRRPFGRRSGPSESKLCGRRCIASMN